MATKKRKVNDKGEGDLCFEFREALPWSLTLMYE